MPIATKRSVAFLLALILSLPFGSLPASATCGGGGGGGMGGASAGGGASAEVYHVAWKILGPSGAAPDGALVVYWFPTSPEDAQGSPLLSSRYLSLTSAQCVGMALVTDNNADLHGKYSASKDRAVVVLAAKDGAEMGRVAAGDDGRIDVPAVESMLKKEIARREDEAKASLAAAGDKADAKDVDAAAALYTQVWEQRCLLPSPAKKAAKGLKKLGRPVAEEESSQLDMPLPDLSTATTSQIVKTLEAGLNAEWDGKISEAKKAYEKARKLDPNDPVPLRYLAELQRHHIGDWVCARQMFDEVLAMRSDAVSRAVALHGLGKMTIHDGKFQKGLDLFEASIAAYPLALTYRNMAVYWNSANEPEKAYGYVKKAMELAPDDLYNQIFSATYLVTLGHPEEAEAIAKRNEDVLPASYNLAVIHAYLGNKDKALEMLRRHFYVYEQFDAVRAKEMQEARDDIAFVKYLRDKDFLELTRMAETDTSSYHRNSGGPG